MRRRVYLGGPINGCTDDEANGWRQQVKPLLIERCYDFIDPMDRDYRGVELEPGVAAEIVEGDKQDIDACNYMLMNCPKPSVGTSMEVLYGWMKDKTIICVLPADQVPSPWLMYHATILARGSVYEAAEESLTRYGELW